MAKVIIDTKDNQPVLHCNFKYANLDAWETKFVDNTKLGEGRKINLRGSKEKQMFTEHETLTLRGLYLRYKKAGMNTWGVPDPK